ncbi:MAG: type II toxin-antitoxin system VapC family toxin, partial [Flavobacteriaceae bacterium]|nr:type II toxin-antitoxin system VapC family toxin [Flavobacteriaceae bacterium]MCY4267318.1 type II toxin-antitoxin system VapC family toxin [Flavobacteriaceae bacterium]
HFKENNLRYETYINFRENLSILELTDVGSNIYLELYREVIRMGINKKDVDHFDILIASSAIEQNLPLVTNNQKDFVLVQKRFPHFNTLNWYDQKISFG